MTAIKLIEAAPAGSVIVGVLDGDKDFAVFGSTFAALAKSRGLAGFIVDGSVRDLSDLRRLDLTTYARGTAPGSAGGHYRIDASNLAIRCGGIEVRPGDYVVGDEDGISVAPKERLAEIEKAARKWQTDKEALVPLILKHRSYLKAMQERDAAKRPN
jgi:regulator of RNase E activity RraA